MKVVLGAEMNILPTILEIFVGTMDNNQCVLAARGLTLALRRRIVHNDAKGVPVEAEDVIEPTLFESGPEYGTDFGQARPIKKSDLFRRPKSH